MEEEAGRRRSRRRRRGGGGAVGGGGEEEQEEEAGRMSRRRGWFWTCQVLDHTYPSCWLTERKNLLLHIRKTLLLKFWNEKFLQMYIMHLLRTACVMFHQQEQRGRGPQTRERMIQKKS